MIKYLTGFFKALKAGERLTNSGTWKNAQTLGNTLLAILLFINIFLPRFGVEIPKEVMASIAQHLAEIMVAVNIYCINATSRKVGFKTKEGVK